MACLSHNRVVTRRKPAGTSFRSWIDRLLDDARGRGEFDELPGAGEPIPGLDKPYDEMWWVKQKLRRENLSYLPPSLALRKAAHDALVEAAEAKSEPQVRRILAGINRQIVEANRKPTSGPAVMLVPFNVEAVVRRWRAGEPLVPAASRVVSGPAVSRLPRRRGTR